MKYEFEFSENPFFENKLLFLEVSLRDATASSFEARLDNLSVVKWKGKENNLTLKMIPAKQSKKQKVDSNSDKKKIILNHPNH